MVLVATGCAGSTEQAAIAPPPASTSPAPPCSQAAAAPSAAPEAAPEERAAALRAPDGDCADDAAEPDDVPNVNQRTRWTALGKEPPSVRVACPGNVDYTQGVGDLFMQAAVRWDSAHGDLAVALVNSDDVPYVLRNPPHRTGGESMQIERGLWTVKGGDHNHFVRVLNSGNRPVRYAVTIEGIWRE